MSADRWSLCPKCLHDINKKIEKSYGKVSLTEYNELLEKKKEILNGHNTLREDYECRTDKDGYVIIRYTCSCNKCGLKYEFTHEDDIDLNKKEK